MRGLSYNIIVHKSIRFSLYTVASNLYPPSITRINTKRLIARLRALSTLNSPIIVRLMTCTSQDRTHSVEAKCQLCLICQVIWVGLYVDNRELNGVKHHSDGYHGLRRLLNFNLGNYFFLSRTVQICTVVNTEVNVTCAHVLSQSQGAAHTYAGSLVLFYYNNRFRVSAIRSKIRTARSSLSFLCVLSLPRMYVMAYWNRIA